MKCDVCGEDMYDKEAGGDIIGISISIDNSKLQTYKKLVKMFGKTKFDVCYCCWIRSLGVMPKNMKEM